jgi:hypothetical protein
MSRHSPVTWLGQSDGSSAPANAHPIGEGEGCCIGELPTFNYRPRLGR